MNVDLNISELMPLATATHILPLQAGKRIHPATLTRWYHRGLNGVRLRCVRVGSRIHTTRAWLEDFASQLAQLDDGVANERAATARPKPRTSRQRERDIARAEKTLAASGI